MTQNLDPARLRRARLAELDYVRREVMLEARSAIARLQVVMGELRGEIDKSKTLLRRTP